MACECVILYMHAVPIARAEIFPLYPRVWPDPGQDSYGVILIGMARPECGQHSDSLNGGSDSLM